MRSECVKNARMLFVESVCFNGNNLGVDSLKAVFSLKAMCADRSIKKGESYVRAVFANELRSVHSDFESV